MRKNLKSAFTIVELLVVMAVIGILITLAVVGIQAIQKSQRETNRANDVRNVVAALEEYYGKFRTYPGSEEGDTSELKLDNTSNQQGICLFKPGQSQFPPYTTSQTGDGDCDVETESGTGLFRIIKFGQSGIIISLADYQLPILYSTYNCAQADMTSESWRVVYMNRGVGGYSQTYGLWYCSENGKSINYGGGYNE